MLAIPEIDLAYLLSADHGRQQEVVRGVGAAFSDVGFAAVKNHGVPQDLIARMYELAESFFEMPLATKKKYEVEDLAGQRGYTSFGREHAKGYDAADLKEFWQIGQTVRGDDPIRAEHPENISASELPEFHETGNALYRAFEETGRQLLRAIAQFLGLGQDYFESRVRNGNSILRAIHYPPITQEPASSIRAERHEDINLITLLVGASADGLQLLGRDGQWLPITAPEGYIIVNVGDMLQRLTNNRLSSTTHRVVNPPREKWSTHRYAIPFFLHPRSEMSLRCLDSCVDADHPRAYEDITAGEYLDERLREIGLKA